MKGTAETTIALTMTAEEAEVLKAAISSLGWGDLSSERCVALGEFIEILNNLGVK